jgi:hypothetical protein
MVRGLCLIDGPKSAKEVRAAARQQVEQKIGRFLKRAGRLFIRNLFGFGENFASVPSTLSPHETTEAIMSGRSRIGTNCSS